MLSVAIAVDPPAEISAAEQVTRSCEQAIGEGRCRVGSELGPSQVVTWYAVIWAQSTNASELRIDFHDRSRDGVLIESRVLSFSERDAATSRWASAGTVIAAFVAARDSGGVARPAPPPVVVVPLVRPSLPPPPRGGLAYSVDLALLSGPALDRGSYRWGGLGRVHLAVPGAPQVLTLASVRYAERPGDASLSLTYWGVAAGLGVRVARRDSPLAAELTFELAFERLSMDARAPDSDAGRREQAHQNRFGGRLSSNVSWRLAGPVGVVVGAEGTALRPAIAVRVGEEDVGRAPAASFAFSLGLRLFGGP